MELDHLKNTWQQAGATELSKDELTQIIRKNKHPGLNTIKRQLLFESAAWILFMVLYYDLFDGDKKPLYANVVLIVGALLLILHNIVGYVSQKNIVRGSNLVDSFRKYASGLRSYRNLSIGTRVIALICLLVFFGSVIDFKAANYWAFGAFMPLILLQVFLLGRIWNGRIRQMEGFSKKLQADS